ncbi:MAG: tellurite resistance methyltransferase TehB [Cycloclasticus sp.]|nr:tellurite resistance methyltransferase TehB [Cycloclasticus sp.]
MKDLQNKWDEIYRQRLATSPEPATVLSRYSHLLPAHGTALDIACGLGGNAFFLAQHSLVVDAWDISNIAIDHINQSKGTLKITATAINISLAELHKNHYDVIVVSRFLDRDISPKIIEALKSEGLLFYQTFTLEKVLNTGPKNPKYLLEKGELLSLFSTLTPVVYHEEACLGDINQGIRNEAILIAQKPKT